MSDARPVGAVLTARATTEGAGVRLKRAFGFGEAPRFDPFLLLDDFRSDDPGDYLAGFPWHPHRGIETVSYLLRGHMRHGDSLGNRGVLGPGDIQWMTAGCGIIHEEMPERTDGRLWGFQLWVNLPADRKMMRPRYQDVQAAAVPELALDGGVCVRVLCGEVGVARGPVRDIVVEPTYLDVTVPAGAAFRHAVPAEHTALAYVIGGAGLVGADDREVADGQLAHLGDGDTVDVRGGDAGCRLLLIAGRPLGEPVAWHGPIVMNTRAELETAFREYHAGTFLKDG